MVSSLFITASCSIARNKIVKDQQIIFRAQGTVESLLDAAYTNFAISYPKFHKMDMLCKLGFLTAEILLRDMDQDKRYQGTDTGIFLSNSHSSLDADLKFAKTISVGASPALFVYTLPNIVIGEISIRHHFKGENAFFVFPRFDPNFMAAYINNLFETRQITNCLCGWVDIFRQDYHSVLFLVEPENRENSIPFTAGNMNHLNQENNG